jgi:hypothetical protein
VRELLIKTDMTLIVGFIAIMLVLASEVGYRIGTRKRNVTDEATRTQITTIEAAVLGIVALLLGFSFSMAEGRYELSKTLLRDEANAIGTTYLRAGMLPQEQGRSIAGMLRTYVDVRLSSYNAGDASPELAAIYEQTDELHAKIWAQARAVAAMDGHSITTGLFVQSLNEMIDMEGKQRSAIVNRIPANVFLLLIFVSAATMCITGYAAGIAAKRQIWIVIAVALLLSAIMLVIGDLHRPRRGMIKVSTSALVDVRGMMDNNPIQ